MALAPCLIGYGAIANRLYTEKDTLREGNRYWKWIENYVADDYTEAVRLGSGRFFSSSFFPSFLLFFLFDCGMADDDRTARDAHAKSLAKSGGRTRQDLHSGNRIGVQLLGYGIGSSSIDRFTGFSSFFVTCPIK